MFKSHKLLLPIFFSICLVLGNIHSFAQLNDAIPDENPNRKGYNNQKNSNKQDSLQHRDKYADSITIFYRYYDSSRIRTIDSSTNDFGKRFPVPYTYDHLGNLGTAARSLLFNPVLKAGWDAGFHQYDIYKYTIENTKFYQTTRPFSELGYLLGSKSEQMIDFVHTQNKKNNLNFSFEYRFINAPGVYRTQNASHNNVRFTFHYQSFNKRYEGFLIYLSNKHATSENGGLVNKTKLDSLALNNPFELNTRLGDSTSFNRNPFNTTVNTGNIYKETNILYRHQYDFGTKDSLVTDSITYKYYYPRFRFQHTFLFSTNEYSFKDNNAVPVNYLAYFNKSISSDTVLYTDKWKRINNEFSVISFPDKNNQSQFAKVGIMVQNLWLTTNENSKNSFYNIALLGEYRNRTRNNVWDILANGKLYLNGINSADYEAFISLKRQLSKEIGTLQIGFQNVNRTPSSIYSNATSFPILPHDKFLKENTTHLFANYSNERAGFILSGNYYLVNNYTYTDSFFHAQQFATLFNVLHVYGEKKFALSKHWNYYVELHLQQTTGGAPINIPAFITKNRIAYEGNFFKNLFLSTGLEARYVSNYTAPNYSPFTGQFFYQQNQTLSNRPDINAFFHFRIRSFKAFVRAENLNTLNPKSGLVFNHYNFKLPDYAGTGFWFRLGIWWNFIN